LDAGILNKMGLKKYHTKTGNPNENNNKKISDSDIWNLTNIEFIPKIIIVENSPTNNT
jgi:hypothetical protein